MSIFGVFLTVLFPPMNMPDKGVDVAFSKSRIQPHKMPRMWQITEFRKMSHLPPIHFDLQGVGKD